MESIVIIVMTVLLVFALLMRLRHTVITEQDRAASERAEMRTAMLVGTLRNQAKRAEVIRTDFVRIGTANHFVEAVSDALHGRRE